MITLDSADESSLPRRVRHASIRGRLASTIIGFGALAVVTCVLAPLVGTHVDQPDARVRSRRFRSTRTSTRRSSSSPDCRACSPARSSAPHWRRPAWSFRRCCAIRSPRRSRWASPRARRSARCSSSSSAGHSRSGRSRAVPLASLAGAAAATAIVYWLASRRGRAMSTSVLLLAGVTLNSFFSALIMFVQYLADFAQVYRAARWLMGDLDVGELRHVDRGAAAGDRCVRPVRAAALVAQSAQRRHGCGRGARR